MTSGRSLWKSPLLMAFALAGALLNPASAGETRDTLEADPSRYRWKLESSENQCRSYSSEVAGQAFVAAKVVCEIAARIDVIGTILRDIEHYPEWMSGCLATRMLKVDDDASDSFTFWWHHHIPILQDRDVILQVTTTSNLAHGYQLIDVHSSEAIRFDAGENLARMPSAHTPFKLEWIDQEHTRVSWMLDMNVGSGVPPAIANAILKQIPYKSMMGLRKMAASKKYQHAARTSKYARYVEDAIRLGQLKPAQQTAQ